MKSTLMKSALQARRRNNKRIWIPIILVLVLAAGGLGYYYWSQQTVATAEAAGTTYNTTKIRQGSITISATGSGTLLAGKERSLAFPSSGTVAEVNVQVGDVVEEGAALASLSADDIADLQASLQTAQQELTTAQKTLQDLKDGAAANLAQAKLDLVTAQDKVTSAKSSLVKEGWMRCDQDTIDAYYYKYLHAKQALEELGDGGGNADYYLKIIVPAKNTVAQALSAYTYCAGYTASEVAASEATLELAEAELKTAQAKYDTLAANNGIDPLELQTAEIAVENAQLAVEQAQAKLDGAILKAPFAGTILSVEGEVGDAVDTGAFLTIADLAHPRVQFSADETDMEKIYVGETVKITFDAVPDRTFQGKVILINPELVTSNGYQVIQGMIEMDLSQETEAVVLPKGINATVEFIQDSAENVLIAPLQALRDLGDGTYGLFVLDASGQPKLTVVEIGLKDAASVEIKSGVSLGDVVTTGVVETK
jgi:multidrug efflux pump subunit AcrA (membrane-fusion protein)